MSYYTELSSYKVSNNLDSTTAYIDHQDKAGADETGPFDAQVGRWQWGDGKNWHTDDTIKLYRTTS